MKYLKSLAAIGHNERDLAGNRAVDLALLRENRFRVPDTVVLLSNAFDTIIEENNLKYKIEYILRHVSQRSPQSFVNAYTGVRKALKEAKFADLLMQELEETFAGLTAAGIGIEKGKPLPVRVIVSPNYHPDPENNDTIIQNVNGWEEFKVAIRESFALAYHPNQLKPRMESGFPENKLKIALIVQVMDTPVTCTHAYSAMPEVRDKLFLQTYYGHLDLRDNIAKDYYALSREGLDILLSEVREQPQILEMDEKDELVVSPFSSKTKHDKLIDRDLQELARLTKKAERILQSPVKCFFTNRDESHVLLWANRLGFETAAHTSPQAEGDYVEIEIPEEKPSAAPVEEPAIAPAAIPTAAPSGTQKLLQASLKAAKRTLQQKYRDLSDHEPPGNLGNIAAVLNEKNAFPRSLDSELLAKAENAPGDLTSDEQERLGDEIAIILDGD